MKLLTVSNAKTTKGEKLGYLTGVLYMAPHTIATKKSLCPFSTPGCREACLYSAGRGKFTNVQESRIKKAQWFQNDRESFIRQLGKDINALIRKAKRENLIPVVRLNGTSDVLWERIEYNDGFHRYENIMSAYPDIQFYDYTKFPYAQREHIPYNYDLTFSYAETEQNQKEAHIWLSHGGRVAAVFETLPERWGFYSVADGDEHDLTFLRPESIIGLKAKGEAKHDTSGFVIRGQ